MSFIGIITNTKNEAYLSKVLDNVFDKEQVIFITDKNVGNMRNIRFETVVIDTKLNNVNDLKFILSNTKYVFLNADIALKSQILSDLNLIVISYGFQNKATFTVSSVTEASIIICLQRIMKSIDGKKYEPQEWEIQNIQNIDIHAIICLKIILLFYEKSQLWETKIYKIW